MLSLGSPCLYFRRVPTASSYYSLQTTTRYVHCCVLLDRLAVALRIGRDQGTLHIRLDSARYLFFVVVINSNARSWLIRAISPCGSFAAETVAGPDPKINPRSTSAIDMGAARRAAKAKAVLPTSQNRAIRPPTTRPTPLVSRGTIQPSQTYTRSQRNDQISYMKLMNISEHEIEFVLLFFSRKSFIFAYWT